MSDSINVNSLDLENKELAIPLAAEVLQIDKEAVETGRVRIIKTVREDQYQIDRPLSRDQADVHRVPINQFIREVPSVRQEGETLVIPIIEEVLVLEKRLMLKEELHITRHRTVEPHSEIVTLRTEQAKVQRVPADASERDERQAMQPHDVTQRPQPDA